MKDIIISAVILLSFTTIISANIIKVPDDQITIQAGINASVNGDTVVVYPGTYYENVKLNGKKILLTSRYYENNDVSYILNTIINGSKPKHKDTTSCVLIINHEDSTTVLQGFTLTGGTGTVWQDEHGAGKFREGGGILIALSSPIIRNNLIINNEATNKTGIKSAGGGGIRAGDANPLIINNVVMRNKGHYGGGIVLNYTGAILKNNIVYQNEGGVDYGSGGIWLNGIGNRKPLLENNTIVNNYSVTDGGGVLLYNNTSITARNNIIWNNIASPQSTASISLRTGATAAMTYSDVQNGFKGEGNISLSPMFQSTNKLILSKISPCVDNGKPDIIFNDPEDPSISGSAKFPSLGSLQNDMGAYGGKGSCELPGWIPITKLLIPQKLLDFKSIEIGDTGTLKLAIVNLGDLIGRIDSIKIKNAKNSFRILQPFPFSVDPFLQDTLMINWIPLVSGSISDTLYIFHNDTIISNPIIIKLIGKGITPTDVKDIKKPMNYSLLQNYPNPFNPSTTINFQIPSDEFITLRVFDLLGRQIETLINGFYKSGAYNITFSASEYPSGIYFYQLVSEGRTPLTKKMMVIK